MNYLNLTADRTGPIALVGLVGLLSLTGPRRPEWRPCVPCAMGPFGQRTSDDTSNGWSREAVPLGFAGPRRNGE